jgi:hypothetical protein
MSTSSKVKVATRFQNENQYLDDAEEQQVSFRNILVAVGAVQEVIRLPCDAIANSTTLD